MNKAGLCLFVGASLFAQSAFAWSEATHAYIADHIGNTGALRNSQELYGAMTADMFNNEFSLLGNANVIECIRSYTHGYPVLMLNGFADAWTYGKSGPEKYAAFGYVGHNDLWGADFNAHWSSKTGSKSQGYIIAKAEILVQTISAQKDAMGLSPWDHLGISPAPNPPPDPLADPARLIAHYFVEKAGDVLIRRSDPSIGAKMIFGALLRPPDFEELFVDILGPCFPQNGAAVVHDTEEAYRGQIVARGVMMLQSETAILQGFASQLAQLAPAYIEAVTGTPMTPALQPMVSAFVSQSLSMSLSLIEMDYMTEVNTIVAQLPATMAANGVSY
jgi:hypothetical protein